MNEPSSEFHRSTRAARWLPRVLAGSVLAAAMIGARGMDPENVVSGSDTARLLVTVFGAALAWWLVRTGGEARVSVRAGDDGVEFRAGSHRRVLEYRDMTAVRFQVPFEARWRWLPALVLVDRFGAGWRVPAFIERGPELLRRILERCPAEEAVRWAEARRVDRSLERSRRFVPIGYVVAVVVLAAALIRTYAFGAGAGA